MCVCVLNGNEVLRKEDKWVWISANIMSKKCLDLFSKGYFFFSSTQRLLIQILGDSVFRIVQRKSNQHIIAECRKRWELGKISTMRREGGKTELCKSKSRITNTAGLRDGTVDGWRDSKEPPSTTTYRTILTKRLDRCRKAQDIRSDFSLRLCL